MHIDSDYCSVNWQLIDDFMQRNDLTRRQFCIQSGVSPYVLKKIYNGQTNFGITNCAKLVTFLGLTMQELLLH